MNNKTFFLTVVLLISVILSSIMVLKVIKKSMSSHVVRSDVPDSFLVSATYSKMDERGMVRQIIYTPSLVHYQSQDSAVFEKPSAILNLNSKEMPWKISADNGSSRNGLETIRLIGNVVIKQPLGKKNKVTMITTEELTIYFNKKYVETDKPVMIEQPGITAKSLGINANFNTKVINLLSNVKEIYLPAEAGDNSGQPIAYLDADKASYDRNNHVSSYFGNIKYSQGTSFLNADKLLIYDNKINNNVEKIIAFGIPAHYSTIPNAKEERIDAIANKIIYYPKKKIAVLIGNSELQQKGNKFSAPYIVYDINKKIILSTAGNCGKNCAQQETTIVIQP